MDIINVEIKARVDNDQYHLIKAYLVNHHTSSPGLDRQSDYYFNTPQGRLKLRIGNVENSLIYYDRREDQDLKTSRIKLYKQVRRPEELLDTLKAAYGIIVEVHKERLIYFIDHVKFHLDNIEGLGQFCEIEAISTDGQYSEEELSNQCSDFMHQLKIDKSMLIKESYSDLLM
ncbi:MAG: class IV adenylate cyclase [Saprospiraceae bacterium]|nr:class IV adenylate cyclase [Saprospiraceae bacterium]